MFRLVMIGSVLGIALASPGVAGAQSDPVTADAMDTADAALARHYRQAAERGDAEAQLELGRFYRGGRGVPKNDMEAARWFRLAADQGNAGAQVVLGWAYEKGRGVEPDYAEAARLYRMAADQGHVMSLSNLAELYRNGRGVPQDHAEAARLFRLAAEKDDSTAMTFLGLLYRDGLGVKQDLEESARWLRRAEERGGKLGSYFRLGVAQVEGRGMPRDAGGGRLLIEAAADKGYEPARAWLQSHPESGPAK